jgi:hypothetical protein
LHGREAETQGQCLMCPDSDGFVMNCLEEGTLGYPVLAGNLVSNQNGRRSPQMASSIKHTVRTAQAAASTTCLAAQGR